MPERSNGLPWKGSVRVTVPRVRIPLSPQKKQNRESGFCFFEKIRASLLASFRIKNKSKAHYTFCFMLEQDIRLGIIIEIIPEVNNPSLSSSIAKPNSIRKDHLLTIYRFPIHHQGINIGSHVAIAMAKSNFIDFFIQADRNHFDQFALNISDLNFSFLII